MKAIRYFGRIVPKTTSKNFADYEPVYGGEGRRLVIKIPRLVIAAGVGA